MSAPSFSFTFAGIADVPAPVREIAATIAARGRPFRVVGSMSILCDDAEGRAPLIVMLPRGCNYAREIEKAGAVAVLMRCDLYLAFEDADAFNRFSRAGAARHGH